MREIVYTLVGEGPSDRRLLQPIDWVVAECTERPFRRQWADKRALDLAGSGLAAKLAAAMAQFPCDVLFVHRDSDVADHAPREAEIQGAIDEIGGALHVKVIPVRMQEAWFLFDEGAIRSAAGKPSGGADLGLPSLKDVGRLADPKAKLKEALRLASERTGRHLRRFSFGQAAARVADLITDYSPLRALAAFQRLEQEVAAALQKLEAEWGGD